MLFLHSVKYCLYFSSPVVGWIMTHKEVYVLNSRICEFYMADKILQIYWNKALDGKIILDYPSGPNIITRVFRRGRQESHKEQMWRWWQKKVLYWWLCRWRKGSWVSQGVKAASRLWKSPSVVSSLEPWKSQYCPHLDLINVGCFKLPSLWWLLTPAIRY